MTDLDWRRVIDRDFSAAALRAYADWLDERGLPALALAQRLLALGSLAIDGNVWRIWVARLPGPVSVAMARYRDRSDRSPEDSPTWWSPTRMPLEAAFTEIALTLLKNGVDLAALVREAEKGEKQ